jgi:hypothetical protein
LIVQEFEDFILIIVLIDQSDMLGRDAALTVDDKGRRKRINAAIKLRHFLGADHNAVVDLVRGDVWPDRLPSVIVERDSQDGEIAVLILLFELDEPGDLDFAGSSPSGPEVQQDDFSSILGQANRSSAGVGE